jgi:hypothetical protein
MAEIRIRYLQRANTDRYHNSKLEWVDEYVESILRKKKKKYYGICSVDKNTSYSFNSPIFCLCISYKLRDHNIIFQHPVALRYHPCILSIPSY